MKEVACWRERITGMQVMIEGQSRFEPFGLPYWGSQDLNKRSWKHDCHL